MRDTTASLSSNTNFVFAISLFIISSFGYRQDHAPNYRLQQYEAIEHSKKTKLITGYWITKSLLLLIKLYNHFIENK